MAKPNRIYLYRITHIDNLDFILKSGKLTCPSSSDCDEQYIGIGDRALVEVRSAKKITIEPKGDFKDYVSFYFGPRSPMLHSIQNGYQGVIKRSPEEIIYLISTFGDVNENDYKYVFSDGHGCHSMSQFFNDEENFDEVDWDAVKLKRWHDTEDDPDRKRRKQAEFLIYGDLPFSVIAGIVVYNESAEVNVVAKLAEHGVKCDVIVKSNLYY